MYFAINFIIYSLYCQNSSAFRYVAGRFTWQRANEYCTSINGRLAVIRNQQQQDQVNQAIGNNWAWIGLSKNGGSWQWVDGTAMQLGYWNAWTNGQPSSRMSNQCVYSKGGKWFESGCNLWQNAVCELLGNYGKL